ncbi:heterokaryon incompatibility protein-domain-containing protein [Xylaria sp. FL1042]|nr:heterokaryon incompatibility protein-domain-containing protein [Xylaria sp. FL1042]
MDKYQYEPLPTSEHIRLVTIYAGRFDDDILLSYDVVALGSNECPSYNALSYTWDMQAGSRPVYVVAEGKTWVMNISSSLADSLLYFRYADRSRVMWIDALCIDQTNNVEKGPQVARMGKVYRSAHRISIWLGPEENDSTRALNTMLWIGSQVHVDWVRFSVALRPECVKPGFQDVNIGIPLRPEDTKAIYHLLSRRWFGRLWIRQEIMLAEATAVIQCGFYQVPWPPLRRAIVCLYQKPRPKTLLDEKLNTRLLSLRGLMSQTPTVPLGYVRTAFGQSDCADPRDRIYALLEFLSEGDRTVVGFPDYTKDPDVVFRDIAWRYIECYRSLDILSHFIYGRSYWRGFASSHFGAMCTISEDRRVLRTPGASITTVEELKDVPTMTGRHIDEQVRETIRVLVQSEELGRRYVTGVSMLEAYARTSVANALRECQEPWLGEDPTLQEAQEIVLKALNEKDRERGPSKPLPGHIREVYKIMRAMLAGRKLMYGSGGYIGTVPVPTQRGDEVCVLLGCHTPMVLRRVGDNVFRIVGECYVLGISEGEALLGPLPDGTRRVFASDVKSGVYSYFVNDRTGYQGLMDPRLPKLLSGLEDFPEKLSEDPNAKIELNPEQLHDIFPQLQEFSII